MSSDRARIFGGLPAALPLGDVTQIPYIWLPKESIISQGATAGKIVFALEHLWGGLLSGTIMLTLFFIVALFLPKRSWVWVYGIVAICVGVPNCCCMPLSIPVLVYWLRPETKLYYGWGKAKAYVTIPRERSDTP